MAKPRVLILVSSFLPTIGGSQFELKWFLDNLDRQLNEGEEFEFHFAYPNSDCDVYAHFDNISTHDLQIREFSKSSMPAGIARLGSLLRSIRPDIVHCHGVLPDGLWVVFACQLYRMHPKIVVTSHGQDIAWLPHVSYGMQRSWKSRLIIRYVVRRISRHVVVSNAMSRYARESGTDEERIVVIPNGIPLEDEHNFEDDMRSSPSADGPTHMDLRRSHGINIISLSSGREIKNLDTLIKAFSMASQHMGDSRLFLACTGPQSTRIARLVEDSGLDDRVAFIGEVVGKTKHEYFRQSEVYCLPSHFESFGLVALEAMKFEVAVLSSNVGGMRDYIKDGVNGLLVSPTDAQGLASALLRLYENPELRKRLVRNGLETVKCYSISRTVNEYVRLYTELVNTMDRSVSTAPKLHV